MIDQSFLDQMTPKEIEFLKRHFVGYMDTQEHLQQQKAMAKWHYETAERERRREILKQKHAWEKAHGLIKKPTNPFAPETANIELAPIVTHPFIFKHNALAFSENIPKSGGDWKIGSYGYAVYTYEGESFSLSYEDPSSQNIKCAKDAAKSGIFEKVVDQLEYTFVLPQKIEIIFTTDKPGPLYYDGKIHITYEFLKHTKEVISSAFELDEEEEVSMMLTIAEFVIYHEVGHAILDILGYDVLKYDENVVDEFSAILSSEIGCQSTIYNAALFFEANAEFNGAQHTHTKTFSELHSRSHEERMDLILCLLYGDNPDENQDILSDFDFSNAEGEECIDLFEESYDIWGEILDEILRDN